MCNSMRNPPYWIVTHGTQNSVPTCIPAMTQCNSVVISVYQIAIHVGHHVALDESAKQYKRTAWVCDFDLLAQAFIAFNYDHDTDRLDGTLF